MLPCTFYTRILLGTLLCIVNKSITYVLWHVNLPSPQALVWTSLVLRFTSCFLTPLPSCLPTTWDRRLLAIPPATPAHMVYIKARYAALLVQSEKGLILYRYFRNNMKLNIINGMFNFILRSCLLDSYTLYYDCMNYSMYQNYYWKWFVLVKQTSNAALHAVLSNWPGYQLRFYSTSPVCVHVVIILSTSLYRLCHVTVQWTW